MKLVGAGLVLVASGLLGAAVAGWYAQRSRQLRDLLLGLHVLETEITHAVRELPAALEQTAGVLKPPVRDLFQQAALLLRQHPHWPAPVAWRQAVAGSRRRLALQEEEVAALEELGVRLGLSAAADQARYLRLVQHRLQRHLEQADQERQVGVRLWHYLGLGGGLMVVLLLY